MKRPDGRPVWLTGLFLNAVVVVGPMLARGWIQIKRAARCSRCAIFHLINCVRDTFTETTLAPVRFATLPSSLQIASGDSATSRPTYQASLDSISCLRQYVVRFQVHMYARGAKASRNLLEFIHIRVRMHPKVARDRPVSDISRSLAMMHDSRF